MRCVATGDPLPELVFKKESNEAAFINGVNEDSRIDISQEVDDQGRAVGVMKIRDLQRTDDGLYTCTGNSQGGETQAWGHITAQFAPTFEEQTFTEVWTWDQKPVNISCIATSIPNATIQWYLRSNEIEAEDPNYKVLSAGPTGVLQINPTDNSYFGMYTCQASNLLGTSDFDIELKQAEVPDAVSNVKVKKITATTISWSITDPHNNGGRPILGYSMEYRLDGTTWDDAQPHFWTKGSEYSVEHLSPDSTYIFRFSARNEVGNSVWGGEMSEKMPVRAAPEEPEFSDLGEGVNEIAYPDHYIIQWTTPLDNGEPIENFQVIYYQMKNVSGKLEKTEDSTTEEIEYPGLTSYKIENLIPNTVYKVELRARNVIGYSTPAEGIFKTAYDPPTFLERPRDQLVINDRVASFTCLASGNPEPRFQWRKNTRRIGGNSRYIVVDVPGGSILRIKPVKYQRDEANYECVAENQAGDIISAKARLTVLTDDPNSLPVGFPYFRTEPKTKAVEIDHTALLVCDARGNPDPTISWYKDNQPVDINNPRYTVLRSGSLQITTSTEEDSGRYECVAENSAGTAFSILVTLYVRVRRVPPRFSMAPDPVYEVMPGENLNISCVAVGAPMPYVQWKKGPAEDMTDNLITKNVLVLVDIQQSANYTCQAQSTLGLVTQDVQVKVQALPRPPSSLQISDITATSVRITWNYNVNPGDISYYVIQYKPRNADRDYAEISGLVTKFYTVIGLTPFTEYEFHVLAVNKIGKGPPSEPSYVTTGETKPGSAPHNVHVRPLSSFTMVIQWDEPVTPNGQITGYKLYYTTNPSLPIQSWKSQPVQDNGLTTISDLTPHTIYTIRVQAYTGIGPGPLSDPVKVKTQQGVPSQPTNLQPAHVTATELEMRWTRPSYQGENIISYELYWNETHTGKQEQKTIPEGESYTLKGLHPNSVYNLWLAAKSQRGEGAATASIAVRTKQHTPGAPPSDIRAVAVDSESILVEWNPPPEDKQHGDITYYKLMYVNNSRHDSDATVIPINSPDDRDYTIQDLKKWTEYRVWMLAGTIVGDGVKSKPTQVRTDEDVPGEPRLVQVGVLNSTSIQVDWEPPTEQERHGEIRGYQIHVQIIDTGETSTVHIGEETKFVVSELQPDTEYQVQVSAITRKGDGARSKPQKVQMPGGVPTKPKLQINGTLNYAGKLSVDVKWDKPQETYGELLGYRLRYGPRDEQLSTVTLEGKSIHDKTLEDMRRGLEYEFRMSAKNHIDYGEESVKFYTTPEAPPSGPPINIERRFQTPGTIVFTWDPPELSERNGVIVQYDIQFNKVVILNNDFKHTRNTTEGREVFGGLEENMEYTFKVRAWTSKGPGPYCEDIQFHTEPDLVRAPMNLHGLATSDSSIEIWWELIPSRGKVIGYTVFYSMAPNDDLDTWSQISVPVTHSAELQNLEQHAEYAIVVAARTATGSGRLSTRLLVRVKPDDVPLHLRAHGVTTHSANLTWGTPIQLNPIHFSVTYSAVKEFVDAQEVTQVQRINIKAQIVNKRTYSYIIEDLRPFTTYTVNVTAVPPTQAYHPPAKITVTTQMAAPQPMVKPDFYGVVGDHEIAMILPAASEEYGPIAFYYLIVVPEDESTVDKNPDQFLTDDLISNKVESSIDALAEGPYIAAKFLHRNIPYSFSLGDSQIYEGFKNRPLQKLKKYKLFVRAVVDTLGSQHLYTSSPFSAWIALDMKAAPSGELPSRPNPIAPTH